MVTDQQVLNEIQYHTMETPNDGASMSTEIWTISRVIGWLNDRTNRFLSETKQTLTRATFLTTPTQVRYDLNTLVDDDLIDLFRVAWLDIAGVSYELQRSDPFQMDHLRYDWEVTSGTPSAYSVTSQPNQTMDIMPPPDREGSIEVLYSKIGAALSNTGIMIPVQDDFCPYIKWGVLADMLKDDGPAHDAQRASYCEARFQEGIDLMTMMDAGG